MNATATATRQTLKDVNAALTESRSELADLKKAEGDAMKRWRTERTGFEKVSELKERVKDKHAEISALSAKKIEMLEGLGVNGTARPGRDGPATNGSGAGWELVARDLDLAGGRNRVEVDLADLMPQPLASISPGEGLHAPAVTAPFVQLPADRRFIYPFLPSTPVEDSDLAINEYRQKGSRTVTGEVIRDPMATSEKAKLALETELVTPSLKQFAVVADEVPNKLFLAIDVFYAWLQNELAYQVNLAIDAHVLAQIAAATPTKGKTGTTNIERARNAVAAMRNAGANPTILVLNPTEAAALDVQKTELAYIFATRDSGSASPLWGLTIIESVHVEKPLVIDPTLLGVLYSGKATIFADPYSEMAKNLTRVRLEAEALFHIRSEAGVYEIA